MTEHWAQVEGLRERVSDLEREREELIERGQNLVDGIGMEREMRKLADARADKAELKRDELQAELDAVSLPRLERAPRAESSVHDLIKRITEAEENLEKIKEIASPANPSDPIDKVIKISAVLWTLDEYWALAAKRSS